MLRRPALCCLQPADGLLSPLPLPCFWPQHLTAATVCKPALLAEMGGEAEEADTSVSSNCFAPLLQRSLRSLTLDVAEAPDAAMAAALRSLSSPTRLVLRMGPAGRRWDDEGDATPALDCQLLGGLSSLRELQVIGRCSLARPANLAGLGALRTLRLGNAASRCLPTAEAHLHHLTALKLTYTSAAQLAADGSACQALSSLPAPARLSLRGERLGRGASQQAVEEARVRQAQAAGVGQPRATRNPRGGYTTGRCRQQPLGRLQETCCLQRACEFGTLKPLRQQLWLPMCLLQCTLSPAPMPCLCYLVTFLIQSNPEEHSFGKSCAGGEAAMGTAATSSRVEGRRHRPAGGRDLPLRVLSLVRGVQMPACSALCTPPDAQALRESGAAVCWPAAQV